jgi:hypothetical protein
MKAMPFRPHEPLLPFPRLPETVRTGHAGGDLGLRPFGLHETDLDVDFDETARPVLVTRLLECCTRDATREEVEPELLWHLPIGKRIECLLTVLTASRDTEIHVGLRCPDPACNETSEIGISVAELAALQEHAYTADRILVSLRDDVLALRRPTGRDQLEWLGRGFADERTAVTVMLRTLALDEGRDASLDADALDAGTLEAIEEAMEEHDPLVRFRVMVRCPECEADNPVSIDLEELSLRRLRQVQLRLLASVHRLAAHYHWSEPQIFSVPGWRRAEYLGLIDAETNR